MATFSKVIDCLQAGGTAWRRSWRDRREIMMQIPQRISKEVVPNMTSLQNGLKGLISSTGSGEIEYHDQVLIVDISDNKNTPARATYYIPTWEDIFADDWTICNPE